MKKILVMLNHQLTEKQLNELKENHWQPEYLNDDEKKIWSNISPAEIKNVVDKILGNHKDCEKAIVQGHFGAVAYTLDKFSKENCYYAHSVRNVVEEQLNDGSVSKKVIFDHVGFFQYI